MKTRTREKRVKKAVWSIARKIPLAFQSKQEQKRWVSEMSRLARNDRKRARRPKNGEER